MLHVDAQVTGLAETIAALRSLGHLDGLYEAHDDAMAILHGAARDYPPEVPGSRYVRTGWLRTGWGEPMIRQAADMITGRIANTVRYAAWVQGDGTQAPIHQGRWETVGQIADRLEDRVVATVAGGVDGWLTQAGF